MRQSILPTLERAVTHHREGRLAEAETLYRAVLDADPGNAAANHLLGVISYQAGDFSAAIDLISRAVEHQPDYAEAHNNLGMALHDSRRLDEAEECYNRALKLRPDYVEALGNLGNLLKKTGRIEAAEEAYRHALDLEPGNARGHNNLGTLLTSARRFKEAETRYRRALELDPGYTDAHSNLLLALTYMPGRSPADLLKEARRYGAKAAAAATPRRDHANSRDAGRRLRVGFVSADLNRHPVGYFLESVFENLDGKKLELSVYATSNKEDDLTEKFRACVSRWRNVTSVPDSQLAGEITAERIDILVDLSGHTAHNRLPLFARKPAPVQVTWLGFGGTTGLETMDYMLCDRWMIPPEEEGNFSERPWRLPDSFVCFTPPDSTVATEPPPALKNGHITFGCFNNIAKIGDEAFSCWAEILHSVPGGRLFLKARALADATVQQHIREFFSGHGVDPERLTLEGFTTNPTQHLAAHNRVDMALDPFPYSGGATTVEALWMGAPVLTLKGDRYVAHISESLLRNMGMKEWVADSRQDYVAKAAAFASRVDALAVLREDLRKRLLASPLCDAPRFARNLEDAFRGMWRTWCETPA